MYQGQSAGDIGSLLRLIQEDKANSVINQPPAAQSGAPVREVVQEPLQSAEDPGSSRVVSTRPEGGGEPFPVAGGAPTMGEMVSGGIGEGGMQMPHGMAQAPVINSGGGGGNGWSPTPEGQRSTTNAPAPASNNNSYTASTNSRQVLGTQIYKAPAKPTSSSRVGSYIVKPVTTPTPTPIRGKTPTKPTIGNAWRA